MPKKQKKVAKKKKVSNANKQRQNVNVKIKIDQSRRTNPREPRQVGKSSLPSRGYTSNSSTPLHTTIMTATPSPAIIQQEPHYAEEVSKMFKDAEMRSNRQLNLLTSSLENKDEQLNELIMRTQLPQTKELYSMLMGEHKARVKKGASVEAIPDEVAFEGVKGFEDPNAKVKTKLKTPTKPPQEEFTPVAKRTRTKKVKLPAQQLDVPQSDIGQLPFPSLLMKRPVGRPKKIPDVLDPVLESLAPPAQRITQYFKTTKQVEKEDEERKALDVLAEKLNEKAKVKSAKKKTKAKSKAKSKRNEMLDQTFSQIFQPDADN